MKIQSTKIPVTLIDDSFLQNETIDKKSWRLIRDNDGLIKESARVAWIEWSEDGRGKSMHDDIAIGRSLLMSPFSIAFTWQTTPVTEIVVMEENFIKFNTKNSTYTLTKIN
jgi:hypothetical protein